MAIEEDLLRGSVARLWALIDQRTRAGADVEAIDKRIWELFGEDWVVMFTDLAGFSRNVEKFGIIHFLQVIHEQHELLLPIVAARNGVLVKSEADSFLILFREVGSAISCAIEMQRACEKENQRRVEEEQILLCVGIGAGRILRVGEDDVWGSQVNAASKLGEDTAKAYEILVTESARNAAGEIEGVSFEQLDTSVGGSAVCYEVIYRRA